MEAGIVAQTLLHELGQSAVGVEELGLLRLVRTHKNLKTAAQELGWSYKKAWLVLERVNNLSKEPMVVTYRGGTSKGQTVLTEAGEALLARVEGLSTLFYKMIQRYGNHPTQIGRHFQAFQMKISTRNQFFGKVTAIAEGPVFCNVELTLSGGAKVVASITHGALEDLELTVGKEAYALIKASQVILAEPAEGLKISTRNLFLGKVVEVFEGQVHDEIVLEIEGGNLITASITKSSTQTIGAKPWAKMLAIFEASSVILMIL